MVEETLAPERNKASTGNGAVSESPISLSISEAAKACHVNRRTIRRHQQTGQFPGAFRDQEGVWRIPLADLELTGLHPNGAGVEEPSGTASVHQLKSQVAVLREQLRATELVSMEREKRIEDLRLILRFLPRQLEGGADTGPFSGRPSPAPDQVTRLALTEQERSSSNVDSLAGLWDRRPNSPDGRPRWETEESGPIDQTLIEAKEPQQSEDGAERLQLYESIYGGASRRRHQE